MGHPPARDKPEIGGVDHLRHVSGYTGHTSLDARVSAPLL
jgi:dihydroxyacetone kinase